jgi:ABC-type lipoprotein export system ATPase subunit
MSLLELRNVGKRHSRAGRTVVVLEDASLSIDAGEQVAVWGPRGSGRTTLLRVAVGIDPADTGSVHFDGRDLATHAERIIGREIAFCQKEFRADNSQTAAGTLLLGLLVKGVTQAEARVRMREALQRVDGQTLGPRRLAELHAGERIRVAIAQALTLEPRLIVVDEPVAGVDLHERDDILLLLRSLADDGIAILMTVGETTGLSGTDQALTIGDGELRGSIKRQLEPVADLTLRRRTSA